MNCYVYVCMYVCMYEYIAPMLKSFVATTLYTSRSHSSPKVSSSHRMLSFRLYMAWSSWLAFSLSLYMPNCTTAINVCMYVCVCRLHVRVWLMVCTVCIYVMNAVSVIYLSTCDYTCIHVGMHVRVCIYCREIEIILLTSSTGGGICAVNRT